MDRAGTIEEPTYADWYATWWRPTWRLAGHLLGDWTDAEDVASEVLLRVWARWEAVGMPDRPEGYLRRAVHNHVASRFRRRDRERRMLAIAGSGDETVAGPEVRVSDRDEVERLLATLPATDRDTLRSYYLDDRATADIAAEFGLETVSIRSRLHRSRRHLVAAARQRPDATASVARTRETCAA